MKKQISRLGFSVLIAVIAFTATAQPAKNNDKKEQQQKQANKKDKAAKAGKSNSGKNDNNGQPVVQKDKLDKENNDVKNNQRKHNGHGNKEKHDVKDNKEEGMNNMNHGNHYVTDGYKWNHETFKDRKKYKNQKKVTICHKFNRDNEPAVTIEVSSNALKAHINHGDVMGDCPAVTDNRFSDIFLRKRKDYYNNLQNNYEQVSYSRSILDYALIRLTDSRHQLVISQNNQMPRADIERKQATVEQLEQNVSLLETLIGVAAELVVNKL